MQRSRPGRFGQRAGVLKLSKQGLPCPPRKRHSRNHAPTSHPGCEQKRSAVRQCPRGCTRSRSGNTSDRPRTGKLRLCRSFRRPGYSGENLRTYAVAPGKHVRTPRYLYPSRVGNLHRVPLQVEEGGADPISNGTAGGGPRHEVSPCKLVTRTASRARRGCPGWAARRDPRGGGTRPLDPVVEVENTRTDSACALTPPMA